jgi:RNA polymerase sigma factor (sigma-70 family)
MAKQNGKEMYGSETDLPITSKGLTKSFEIYQRLYKEGMLRLESRLTRRQVHEVLEKGMLLQDNFGEETYSLAEIILEQVEGNEWLMKRHIPEHIFRKYGWERSKIERIAVNKGDYEIDGVDESDDLAIYMRSIRDHPIYAREEQVALGRRIRNGDMQARNMLVVSHLRLVARMAKDFHYKSGKRLAIMDFIGWGNELLMDATKTYNPSDGTPFTAYIIQVLKNEFYEKIHKYVRNIKMPDKTSHKLWKLRKEINLFMAEHIREPTVEELVHIMDWKEAKVRRVYRIHKIEKMPFVDAEYQLKESEENEEEGLKRETDRNLLYDRRQPSAEEVFEKKELKEEIDKALSYLESPDRLILELLSGLLDGEEHTFREAEEIMNKSYSGVKVGKTYQSMKNHHDKAIRVLQENPKVGGRLGAFVPETHHAS